MAIPYHAKFSRALFRRLLQKHLEMIVLIRHDAKYGDRAQAVQAKPQERAPLRPRPQTSPAPVTTTMI